MLLRRIKNLLRDSIPGFLEGFGVRLEASPLGQRLLRGAFWSHAGSFVSRALGLAAAVVVARVSGKAIYGQLGIIQSRIGMFGRGDSQPGGHPLNEAKTPTRFYVSIYITVAGVYLFTTCLEARSTRFCA